MGTLTREQILDAELSPGNARINRIARQLRERVDLSSDDREFLAGALQKIVGGDDPRKALGISGKKGQGRKPMTAAESAKWFQRVVRVEQLRRDYGLKLEPALGRVADDHHVARDSLVRYHKKYRNQAIGLLSFIQNEMAIRERVKKLVDC